MARIEIDPAIEAAVLAPDWPLFLPRLIPTVLGKPYYSMRTRLDGREFNLRFAWNERAARWAMDIYDDEENLIVGGVKIVANWPLLRFYQHDDRMPPGEIMATDLSTDGSPPGFADLGIGKRCVLTYFPITDL